jgi:hypothetical protein
LTEYGMSVADVASGGTKRSFALIPARGAPNSTAQSTIAAGAACLGRILILRSQVSGVVSLGDVCHVAFAMVCSMSTK